MKIEYRKYTFKIWKNNLLICEFQPSYETVNQIKIKILCFRVNFIHSFFNTLFFIMEMLQFDMFNIVGIPSRTSWLKYFAC